VGATLPGRNFCRGIRTKRNCSENAHTERKIRAGKKGGHGKSKVYKEDVATQGGRTLRLHLINKGGG